MTISGDTPRENLTLTETDLAACRPLVGEGGHVLRALCPFHGSDHQRSLRVTLATGRFVCCACGAWGSLAEARERWRPWWRSSPRWRRGSCWRWRATYARGWCPARSHRRQRVAERMVRMSAEELQGLVRGLRERLAAEA